MFARFNKNVLGCSMVAMALAAVVPAKARAQEEIAVLLQPEPLHVRCVTRSGSWSRQTGFDQTVGDPIFGGGRVYAGVTLSGDLAGTSVQADASTGVAATLFGNSYDLAEVTAHGDVDRSVAHAQAALYVFGNLVRSFSVSAPTTLPISAYWGTTVTGSAPTINFGPFTLGGTASVSVYGGLSGTAQLGPTVVKLDLDPWEQSSFYASAQAGPLGVSASGTLLNVDVPFTAQVDATRALACFGGPITFQIDGAAHIRGGGGAITGQVGPFGVPSVTLPSFSADIPFSAGGVI